MSSLRKRQPFEDPENLRWRLTTRVETKPSPPSTVQREIAIDLVDPVAPVDVPIYIAVGHKRHS
jgi:hypothetical protein